MLDSLGRRDRKRKPVSLDELGLAMEKEHPRRIVDELKKNRVKILKPFFKSSFTKVRLKKPFPRRIKILGIIGGIGISLVILGFLIFQTPEMKILSFLLSFKNSTYIIGFQNSAELRPTGGFWGSFAIWDVGKSLGDSTLSFETNPYKNDNKLLERTDIPLPKPMQQVWIGKTQSFVNANWPIDFRESAKTIQWYIGQGWQKQSNGVIAISSLSMIDLLRLTGPIRLDDGTQLSSDNFSQTMSEKIDTQYWQDPQNVATNEPKTIIKQMAPKIIEKARTLPKLTLYRFVLDQFRRGRFMIYLDSSSLQSEAEAIGVSGRLEQSNSDFLEINNANLDGGKSSLDVNQDIAYSVESRDNMIHATLNVKRSYPGHPWPDVTNRNYMRVVVPLGSKITSASLEGQDITSQIDLDQESGKTTFGFWFSLQPSETKSVTLNYELPLNPEISAYRLVFQKQPGTLADKVKIDTFGNEIFNGPFDKHSVFLP
jgi:hypothetical protein